jgi:hypothetical protein
MDTIGSALHAIENLIARYAELIDAGDSAAVGALLAEGSGGPVTGAAAIEQMYHDMLVVYDDGTPKTRHVTTNTIIELDDATATARSAFTVIQATPGLPLQPIVSGPVPRRLRTDSRMLALQPTPRPRRSRGRRLRPPPQRGDAPLAAIPDTAPNIARAGGRARLRSAER